MISHSPTGGWQFWSGLILSIVIHLTLFFYLLLDEPKKPGAVELPTTAISINLETTDILDAAEQSPAEQATAAPAATGETAPPHETEFSQDEPEPEPVEESQAELNEPTESETVEAEAEPLEPQLAEETPPQIEPEPTPPVETAQEQPVKEEPVQQKDPAEAVAKELERQRIAEEGLRKAQEQERKREEAERLAREAETRRLAEEQARREKRRKKSVLRKSVNVRESWKRSKGEKKNKGGSLRSGSVKNAKPKNVSERKSWRKSALENRKRRKNANASVRPSSAEEPRKHKSEEPVPGLELAQAAGKVRNPRAGASRQAKEISRIMPLRSGHALPGTSRRAAAGAGAWFFHLHSQRQAA